jgi:hypothetical protein
LLPRIRQQHFYQSENPVHGLYYDDARMILRKEEQKSMLLEQQVPLA